jgi:hypothetical protein
MANYSAAVLAAAVVADVAVPVAPVVHLQHNNYSSFLIHAGTASSRPCFFIFMRQPVVFNLHDVTFFCRLRLKPYPVAVKDAME